MIWIFMESEEGEIKSKQASKKDRTLHKSPSWWVRKSPKTCLRSIWMYLPQKFEYVEDMEAQGDTPYYCDCCDPARQKKRQYSESDSEDAEDENEDGEYIFLFLKYFFDFS